MHSRVQFSALVVVFLCLGCTPITSSSVRVAASPASESPVVPTVASASRVQERHILYSPFTGYLSLLEEMNHVAKVVHPRYSVGVAPAAIKYGGESKASVYIEQISSGVSRVIITPRGYEEALLVEPILEAFARAGLTIEESGLPDFQPISVPILTVSSGGEFFRYYSGTDRQELLGHARSCQTDYMVGPLGSGGIHVDATDMPDGRSRLYVDIHDFDWGYARLQEVHRHIGLFLACLDDRFGTGLE